MGLKRIVLLITRQTAIIIKAIIIPIKSPTTVVDDEFKYCAKGVKSGMSIKCNK